MKNLILLTIIMTAASQVAFGAGPFSEMSMLHEKTFLKVDVLEMKIEFGEETASKFQELIKKEAALRKSKRRENIATAALNAKKADVKIRFLRDISWDQFASGIETDLKCVVKAGILKKQDYQDLIATLPGFFSAITERGLKNGDRLTYEIKGTQLRTRYEGPDGKVLMDRAQDSQVSRDSVLGTYFAPCSQFRDPLIESLSG